MVDTQWSVIGHTFETVRAPGPGYVLTSLPAGKQASFSPCFPSHLLHMRAWLWSGWQMVTTVWVVCGTWSPHFQSTPLMTLVPIFIMAARSGPETGSCTGVVSFLVSSKTVAAAPRAEALMSSSTFSQLGPTRAPKQQLSQWTVTILYINILLKKLVLMKINLIQCLVYFYQ